MSIIGPFSEKKKYSYNVWRQTGWFKDPIPHTCLWDLILGVQSACHLFEKTALSVSEMKWFNELFVQYIEFWEL